jgi:subtilisin-like proprotein convertase family protein
VLRAFEERQSGVTKDRRRNLLRGVAIAIATWASLSGALPQATVAESGRYESHPDSEIPDATYNGTVGSMGAYAIDLSALPRGHVVRTMAVVLRISHTYVGDLTIKLRSPEGTLLTLMERPAGDGPNPGSDDGDEVGGDSSNLATALPLIFADAYPTSAEDAGKGIATDQAVCLDDQRCAFHATPDRAGGPFGFADAFSGQQVSGVWTLLIGDSAGGDQGRVVSWELDIQHARPLSPCTTAPFTDVSSTHPFCSEIKWMREEGLSSGYEDGTFRPSAVVTRQAVAAFLARLGDAQLQDCQTPPFSDIPVNHPFCREIQWMKTAELTSGYEDGTYRPAAAVTRQAISAFLFKLWQDFDYAPTCSSAPFSDVALNHPFCQEIRWMRDNGISSGYSDGSFRPADVVTRQALSAFLYRTDFRL